jgi:membrane protein YdbS with pleckstrin-like domain
MIESVKNRWLWAGIAIIWIIGFSLTGNAQANAPPGTRSLQANQHHIKTYLASGDDYSSSTNFHQESEKSSRRFLLITLCVYGGIALLLIAHVLLAVFGPEVGEIKSPQPRLASGIAINRPVELKPERMSYMLRNGSIPFLLFLFTLWRTYPFDSVSVLQNAITPMALAFLYLIRQARLYNTTIYELNETEVRIKSRFFIRSVRILNYRTIMEVRYKQAFYEKKKNVGTVEMITGYDEEGTSVTIDLIGIHNHKEIAILIAEKAGIKI